MIISKNNYASMLKRAIMGMAKDREELELINKALKHYAFVCEHSPDSNECYISDNDYARLMLLASYL